MGSEEPHRNEGVPLSPWADIGCTLALLTSQVQPPPYPPTGVGHDPQPRLQYSSHHCNVGAVPQQPPVAQLAVFGKNRRLQSVCPRATDASGAGRSLLPAACSPVSS